MMSTDRSEQILKIVMTAAVAACLVLSAFMYIRLPKNNYVFQSNSYEDFTLNQDSRFAVEEYDVTDKAITCRGWFALEKEASSKCKKMTLFISTNDSHLFYKMKTERSVRNDVDAYLKKRLPDPLEYRESGFSASISRKTLPADTYHFYVYYESAQYKVMKKLPYTIILKDAEGGSYVS